MKNKLIFVFFAVTALLCCFVFSASAGFDINTDNILELDSVDSLYQCLAKGDVDDSGRIEASDARVILRVSVNLDKIDTSAFMKADIDSDGKITAKDARIALRLSVGLEKLPEHNIQSITVVPATCKTEGLTVKICTSCVKIYAQITEPASSDYHIPGNWETIEKNTCVKDGLAQIKCISCNEVVKELKLPATGIHNLTEWTYPEGKNCERDMPKVRTCKDCDYSEKGIDGAGHDYKYVTEQKKTCVQDGIEIYKCVECGKEGVDHNGKTVYIYKAPGAHSFEDTATVLKDATCTETGIAAHLCIYCDEPKAEIEIPAKGHTYDKYHHVTLEPTCTETGTADAVCTVCGFSTEVILDKIEHDIIGDGWQETLSPTCTEEGTKEGYCRYCRADVTEAIPATGHSITVWENVKPATCAEEGLKKGICSVCGDDTITEPIEKLPHNFDRNTKYWYEGIPCQEPWKYYNKCTVCGAKEYYLTYKTENCTSRKNGERQTRTITEATCTEPATVIEICIYCGKDMGKARENGKPLGHDFETAQWTVLTPETCTQNGWKTAECARGCGETTKEIIFAKGHSYSDFITTLEPTCTQSGEKTKTCADCGDEITASVPSKGHRFVDYVLNDDVTCTESGTKTAYCSNGCGTTHTLSDVPALGHSFTNYISDNNLSCTQDGTKTAVCDNGCGTTHSIVETKATGHTFSVYTPDNNVTCTQDGTKSAFCDNGCGAKHSITDVLATGHTPGTAVKENEAGATCNKAQYHEEVVYCTVCSGEISRTPVYGVTLPHTPETIIIADSGELDENGNYIVKCKKVCSVCGEDLGDEAVIEILTVISEFDVTFTEFEGYGEGDKVSFTVDNGETDIIVMLSYGKENTIPLEAVNGEYSFTIPEGLSAEDKLFIVIL